MPSVNSGTVFYHMQNIKKLLKIPYSKSHVSMAVHRVGRTLLLDELDIQELFMSSSQVDFHFALIQIHVCPFCLCFNPDFNFNVCGLCVRFLPAMCMLQTGDWTWLKEFYQRLMDQKWQRKKKSKEHWYQKAILSKFLYYRSVLAATLLIRVHKFKAF